MQYLTILVSVSFLKFDGLCNSIFGDYVQEDNQAFKFLECGVTREVITSNFTNAMRGEFPWQAIVLAKNNENVQFACSGILVHKYFVLAGPMCRKTRYEDKLTVVIGASDLNNVFNNISSSSIHDVSKIYYENKIFEKSAFILLKLKTAAVETPICLNQTRAESVTKHCYLVGWLTPKMNTSEKTKPMAVCHMSDYAHSIFNTVTSGYSSHKSSLFSSLYNSIHSYFTDVSEYLYLGSKKMNNKMCPARDTQTLRKFAIKYNSTTAVLQPYNLTKYNITQPSLPNEICVGSTVICKMSFKSQEKKCMVKRVTAQYSVVALVTGQPLNTTSVKQSIDFIRQIIEYEQ